MMKMGKAHVFSADVGTSMLRGNYLVTPSIPQLQRMIATHMSRLADRPASCIDGRNMMQVLSRRACHAPF